ncbi:MAG: phosphoglucosamine mutase, partial [Candidatus Aenigmarchaeota archaeon]|nr:phosphoglucosamine mutase [Candidatus Aenigmarchaeota archaeon]
MARYFGTNGVRGKFELLNPALALELARAIGTYFGSGKILVARDARLTGDCLRHAVVAGLESVGCEVVDLDYASAPTAEFMIRELRADGLIIITASHNPPEWNALKVVDGNGVTISRERGEEIEKLMGKVENADWSRIKPKVEYPTATLEHIDSIKRFLDVGGIRKRKLKIVLDCGNGMAALIAPALFRELGCSVVLLNEKIDGRFPGRPSEPTEANISELKNAVKKEKADAGIAWDGDGDRVIFVDERGKFVVGDKVFALSVLLKLKEENGMVVTTVATSKA